MNESINQGFLERLTRRLKGVICTYSENLLLIIKWNLTTCLFNCSRLFNSGPINFGRFEDNFCELWLKRKKGWFYLLQREEQLTNCIHGQNGKFCKTKKYLFCWIINPMVLNPIPVGLLWSRAIWYPLILNGVNGKL